MIMTDKARQWLEYGKASDMYGKLNDGEHYFTDDEIDAIFYNYSGGID